MHWAEDIAVRPLRTGLAEVLALGALWRLRQRVAPAHHHRPKLYDRGQCKRAGDGSVARMRGVAGEVIQADVSALMTCKKS